MKKSLGAKTFLYPTPVLLMGTYDGDNKPNLMTVAWGGICCSVPPCVTVSLRKATHSYGSIVSRKAFTINIPSSDQVEIADYFGIESGRNTDKFKKAGITEVKSDIVEAPYGEEFSIVLECKLLHTIKIGLHTQFIGEIMDVKASQSIIGKDGRPNLEKIDPIIYDTGGRNYFSIGKNIGKAFSIGKNTK